MKDTLESQRREKAPDFRCPNSGRYMVAVRFDDDTFSAVKCLAQYHETSFAARVRMLVNRGLGVK